MNEKDNKTFFEDLPKEQQKEFYKASKRYFGTIRKVTINGKEWYEVKELTQLKKKRYDTTE